MDEGLVRRLAWETEVAGKVRLEVEKGSLEPYLFNLTYPKIVYHIIKTRAETCCFRQISVLVYFGQVKNAPKVILL
ncbi:MAG TPA: hypothetical protein VN374_02585 [Desulfitobacteriaceae bacterium]|nr:hypothetical protein [Desulfitobacteriaceae bacterium]